MSDNIDGIKKYRELLAQYNPTADEALELIKNGKHKEGYDKIIEGSTEDLGTVEIKCFTDCEKSFYNAYYAVYLDHPELISFLGISAFMYEDGAIKYNNYQNLGKIKAHLGAMRIEREMEKVEGTDLYRMPFPKGVTNIIFSTGVKDSDVAKGVVAYQTDDLVFSNVNNSGKIYKIDLSVEPEQGTGRAEKTKFRYKEGSWRDYTE